MRMNWILQRNNSGEIARNRLKLLLLSDKVQCSPVILEMVKEDMVHVLSKYMEIDSDQMELKVTKLETAGTREKIPTLYANIPIREITGKRT